MATANYTQDDNSDNNNPISSTMSPAAKRAKISHQSKPDDDPSTGDLTEDFCLHDDSDCDSNEHEEDLDMYHSPLETDVGISEYISQPDFIQGSIKQRYCDFIVHEINQDGQIIKLENLDLPASTEEIIEDTDDMLSEDLRNELQVLSSSNSSKKFISIDLKEKEDDKDWRTKVHKLIRQQYPDLESTTMVEDNKKFIKVVRNRRGNRHNYIRWRNDWGTYCKFRLYKENIDTMNAINLICKLAGLRPSIFGYAGTKDRRAITTQQITAFKVPPAKLHHVNNLTKNLRLGNFEYCKNRLTLGDLAGNHFTITLRNVKGSEEQIQKAMISLKDTGFINYYGLQRFGTSHIPTYQIGKELLLGNWLKSIELILQPSKTDAARTVEARQHWWKHRDPSAALKLLGSRRGIEYYLFKGLIAHGSTSLLTAIMMIPRNARLLYVYSYQSLVWNLVASRRIKEFGLKPIVGDLAICKTARKQGYDMAVFNPSARVRVLKKEDLSHYCIHDIVMPLPGHNVIYPQHEANNWYHQQMRADGISINNLENRNKDFSLCGMYRKLIVKPKDMTWSAVRYDDPTLPLCSTDLDQLRQNNIVNGAVTGGKNMALLLNFSLPPSSYATMALREVIKCDTSWHQQRKLSDNYMKAQEETTK